MGKSDISQIIYMHTCLQYIYTYFKLKAHEAYKSFVNNNIYNNEENRLKGSRKKI